MADQDYIATGYIYDSKTKAPVEGVRVQIWYKDRQLAEDKTRPRGDFKFTFRGPADPIPEMEIRLFYEGKQLITHPSPYKYTPDRNFVINVELFVDIEQRTEQEIYQVSGYIFDQQNKFVPNIEVQVWNKDSQFLLESARTNSDGFFEVIFNSSEFGEQIPKDKFQDAIDFKIFSENKELKIDTREDASELGKPNEVKTKLVIYSYIQGVLTDAHKNRLSGYTIIVSEYDLDGTKEIARTSNPTKDDGVFEFEFNFNKTLREGDANTAPDLMFQILDSTQKQQSILAIFTHNSELETVVPALSASKQAPIVLMNAPSNINLRIVVDLQQRPLTEFEELISRLDPYIKKENIETLKEDDANFQISFLSKESGIEKKKIEQLRNAFQQAREFTNIPAWAFFGLDSINLSFDLISFMPVEKLITELQTLQPDFDKNDLNTVATNLQQLAKQKSVQTQIIDLKNSVKELIQPILNSDVKLNTFLDAYVQHNGDTENFWKQMSNDASFNADIPKIQLNLQLSHLTLNNVSLINALQDQKKITTARQLVDLPSKDWEDLALAHKEGIPPHITGKDDPERAKIYAQELQTLVELAFPTDVVKKTIESPEVKSFFDKNSDFDITRVPLETYLYEKEQQGLTQPEETKSQLRKIQRLYTLTANAADMKVLMDMNYESAHQISQLSAEDFALALTDKISEDKAYIYHAKAVEVSEATAIIHMQLHDAIFSYRFKAMQSSLDTSQLQQRIPEWRNLFGPLDMCECQHCKSVYSPAAYFVDLLHILLGQHNGAARTEIFRRRPDLKYTKLSCEHTETLIPYIDLVNEILETYVAQDHVGDDPSIAYAEISANDTSDFTASELAANPQHPNENSEKDAEKAYDLLKNAIFPLNLPFDMNLETMRQFLQEQNSSRFEIMQIFGFSTSHPIALASEQLRISPREFEILTSKTLDDQSANNVEVEKLWGISSPPTGKPLEEVSATVNTFLESANISYSDLINLWKTHFLNPYFPLITYFEALSEADRITWLAEHPVEAQCINLVIEKKDQEDNLCDLNKIQIKQLNDKFLSKEKLSLFNRFIRLWKKLGCTIAELDAMLTSIGDTDLTPKVINELSGLWQVNQYLNLSFEQLAVLIGNIPTFGENSLYARLFLNKAIQQIDEKFGLNTFQTELESASYNLLILMYTTTPPDEEIEQNKLYLYLDQDSLMYAVKVADNIKRIKIDNNDLVDHFSNIQTILSDTNKAKQLSSEDKKALFAVTSKQGNNFAELLCDHIPAIIAALQITEEDFNRLKDFLDIKLNNALLNLTNISLIYRYVLFAKGLGISIEDLVIWFKLISLSPWKNIAELITVQEQFTKLKSYGFKASDFDYIFHNTKIVGNLLPPKNEIIAQSAKTLREGLLKIHQENAPQDGVVTADFLKKMLGIILQPEEVNKIISILDNTNINLKFNYLLQPEIIDEYENILKNYLTQQDVIVLENFLEEYNLYLQLEEKDIKPAEIVGNAVILVGQVQAPQRIAFFVKDKQFVMKGTENIAVEINLNQAEQNIFQSLNLGIIDSTSVNEAVLNIFKNAVLKADCFSNTNFAFSEFTDEEVSSLKNLVGNEFKKIQDLKLENGDYKNTSFTSGEISDIQKKLAEIDTEDAKKISAKIVLNFSARLKIYWEKIDAKLLPFLRKTFVQQHLISTFKTDAAMIVFMLQANDLLNDCLRIETDTTDTSLEAYTKQYIDIYKCLLLTEKLKLSAKELSYFQQNTKFDDFNWKDFNFKKWLRIADYVALRNSLPLAEMDLLSIFETAKKGKLQDVINAIINVTAWDEVNVNYFTNKLTCNDFLDEIQLINLQKQIALSQKIGVSIAKLESWATTTVDRDQVRDIKRSLKAKYEETAWIEVSTIIYNRLRIQLRDSLAAYLLEKSKVQDAIQKLGLKKGMNALYSYFLIDIEMDACMQTSRLKQAIASVQLFVHRCLLNLESPQVLPSAINEDHWKWMKNYRVWEANRKVFLYPENWIEPELRDDKSPFFKELESELLQDEITNENVEKALMNYLEKLNAVAHLDICGMYEDNIAQELHVFGRTFSTPPQYFYRKLNQRTQVWSAWEKVQVDIQSNEEGDSAGVHLIPVVWNRRLYLFWPIFTEKPDREENEEEASSSAYYEVRLAWSEYTNKKWTGKKISQSFIKTPSYLQGRGATYNYRFSLKLGSVLTINLGLVLRIPDDYWLIHIGKYQLSPNGKVSVFSYGEHAFQINVIDSKQVNLYQSILSAEYSGREIKWHEDGSSPLILRRNTGKKDILSKSEAEYKVLFSADHNFANNITSRFIYQDDKRCYDVEPITELRQILGGFQKNDGIIIPLKVADIEAIREPINKGDPSPFNLIEKIKNLPLPTLDRIMEEEQISASSEMQIRAVKSVTISSSVEMKGRNLSYKSSEIANNYFGAAAVHMTTKLSFKPLFHRYVPKFMEILNTNGIEGLLNIYTQQFTDLTFKYSPGGIGGGQIPTGVTNKFEEHYGPNKDNVAEPYPMEVVDFSFSGSFSIYNWELFFHLPMLLANRLSKNQRFEEAMRWYHFVFNPTTNENLDSPTRYWQVMPFRNTTIETLDSLLKQLRNPPNDPKREELENSISRWRDNPFNPHLIARMRLIAYQKNTVMKYLDNLIAWGDNLFRQDTIESINQATQLYILAAEILGKRPEMIPARNNVRAFNYDELENKGLNALSNTYTLLETAVSFFNIQAPLKGFKSFAPLLNAKLDYFCLPNNDKLLEYWDIVSDRLYKIRHCQNIEGIERQLALFEPPINPALLVQAVAGGVDISSVLADLNSPLPYYRFNYIIQKALEICSELKSLGSNLLSALEKKDGETLSIMRAEHEILLLNLAKTIKKLQVTEAQRNKEGLEKTRAVTEHRANFYTQLLKDGLNSKEKEHLTLSAVSIILSAIGQFSEMTASLVQLAPDVEVGAIAGAGGGPTNNNRVSGGDKNAHALSAVARFFQMCSTMTNFAATTAQTNAGYQRRADDWKLQQDLATKELAQIDKQILAAKIREQIANQELINHEQQIENARQVDDFLRNKYTQEELYGWLIGEISTIYFQCYQLAYDLAKKAEKAYRYELGLPASNFIQFGVWDSFRKGLMSGERLYLSLKQMEKSYMDQNHREYEITKNISLFVHNQMALFALKKTGSCIIELPENWFDMDYPGHYMRRIKSVSLSIPCIVGPYTSVSCTLTLLSSEVRVKSTLSNNSYTKENDTDDNRFITNFSATQSIATSHAQNDSGLFELNFRDERYLPFEGSGAISRWRIELPVLPITLRQFDYDTISDVILHLKYTSREGGKELKNAAIKNLNELKT